MIVGPRGNVHDPLKPIILALGYTKNTRTSHIIYDSYHVGKSHNIKDQKIGKDTRRKFLEIGLINS